MLSILPSKYNNTDFFFKSVQPYREPFPLSNALLPLSLWLQSLDIPGDQEDDVEDEVHSSVIQPKTAKNRGEPQKMTPSSETEFFLGWFRWESCSPGYSGHLLHQQKSRSLYKKLTFGPKYPNFGVKKAHFCP